MPQDFTLTSSSQAHPPALTPAPPSVSVFGLGYVGAVSAACLSELGVRVHGVDLDPSKVSQIAAGRSPIVEAELDALLQRGVASKLITASADARRAIAETDVSFVSVATPTAKDGGCDLSYVRRVGRDIGLALARKKSFHIVVMRCSAPPGTTLDVLTPEIEHYSGKRRGEGFDVCFNPEFLREGVAVADFRDPPKTVIGADNPQTAAVIARLYAPVDPKPIVTSIAVAEMVKYVDNVWHATKVVFANEVGRISKPLGIDSHEIMDIFVQDEKLNLSPYYLKPGFAFGGSCLPKEVRAVSHIGQRLSVSLPLIDSLISSNEAQIASAEEMIRRSGARRVSILGLTFKPDTDDLRESPYFELAARLHAQGYDLVVHDGNLRHDADSVARRAGLGAGKPHWSALLEALPSIAAPSAAAALTLVEAAVVCHPTEQIKSSVASCDPCVKIIDLARIDQELRGAENYEGVGW